MKLLIVTQVIDQANPVLGFFHRWVEEFAKHCESIEIIALEVGNYSLPSNVKVYSLGKEKTQSRLKYICKFYKIIWSKRCEYDAVFVHMNQIYILLGGLLWRWWGKEIGLWYMHGQTSLSLQWAEKVTNKIFTGSPSSFRLRSKKVIVTGHGINTDMFQPSSDVSTQYDLITVGRITKAKGIHTMLELMRREASIGTFCIVGQPITGADVMYMKTLKDFVLNNNLSDRIVWYGSVQQSDLPRVLAKAKVFLHMATNGSLDKVILEALACGVSVVSTTKALPGNVVGFYTAANIDECAKIVCVRIAESFYIDISTRDKMHQYIKSQHSLKRLVSKIMNSYGTQ